MPSESLRPLFPPCSPYPAPRVPLPLPCPLRSLPPLPCPFQACDGVSMGVQLAADGSLSSYRLVPSRVHVRPSCCLTYDQADALIMTPDSTAPPELRGLYDASVTRYGMGRSQRIRGEGGAASSSY